MLATLDRRVRTQSNLFMELSKCTLHWSLAWLYSATGAIDLTGPEAALLADQQDAITVEHEQERRSIPRLPTGPVDITVGRKVRVCRLWMWRVPRHRANLRWDEDIG